MTSLSARQLQILQRLLARAGARVPLARLETWTLRECRTADAWACAQITAREKDPPTRQTSVRWPDHVGAASRSRRP